jgi:dolichyl-phosphate beta-glucosyltransferase
MTRTSISVVIPCFNEEQVIAENLRKAAAYLASRFETFEIIAVSDGSTDGTVREIRKVREELPEAAIKVVANPENQGKGAAVKAGVLESRYETVMFLDADLTIPIEELDTFLPHLERNDIAIASRLLPETVFEEKVPWYRSVLAKGFQLAQAAIVGNFDVLDSQCGFKVFTRTAALDIFPLLTVQRFAFDAEVLFLARRFNYAVKQLPVTVRKDDRESHVRLLGDPVNMLFDLIRIRINALLGKYSATEKTRIQSHKARTEDTPAS